MLYIYSRSLIFMLLSFLMTNIFCQEIFVESKAKVKLSPDGKIQLKFVKIFTESGQGSVFMKNMSPATDSPGIWEVFTEPGGKIQIENKNGLWGNARLGQVYIEIEQVKNDADGFSGWRLFTRKDTVYVSEWQQISSKQERYSANMFRRYHHLLLPSGEPFDINLLTFLQVQPGKNTVDISESGKISDYPGEFKILAAWILMKSLVSRLAGEKQR
ncbi:MAG: hypothetical protein R3D00_26410 [Bacteroidia bacterium]